MHSDSNKKIIAQRMARRGLKERDIDFFLTARDSMNEIKKPVDWQAIRPVSTDQVITLPEKTSETFKQYHQLGLKNLEKCAVIKLNGGRSTTMGGKQPKCMVMAKDDLNFLDIVMSQIIAANDQNDIEMPLVLMNSFFTDHVTEKIVGKTPLIIMNFIQNEFPRLQEDTLLPLDTGTDEDWCPGGHGDFFFSIDSSGMLDSMLELGLRYAFISNIDNLSAVVSPEILGLMLSGKHDFCMEVTRKTEADIKGGAPVLYNDTLSLLEIAQVPEENKLSFQDISTFSFFNTNNLWVDLQAVKKLLQEDRLQLPIIQNRKNICDKNVIQIETAMGAALQCFNRPGLIEVSRSRFAPVKTVEDLLDLRSDLYIMKENYQISRKSTAA